MLVVLTLLAVAGTDLLAMATRGAGVIVQRSVQAGWLGIVVVACALWVRPEAWAGLVAAGIAAAWYWVEQRHEPAPGHEPAQSPEPAELRAHVGVQTVFSWAALGLIAVLADFTWLDVALLSGVVPAGLLWCALALFLTQTGNRITRAVLLLSGREQGAPGAVPHSQLKGGRVIGPLERIFMMVLIAVAAYPVVAALMAAKGIVRFPEISAEAKRAAPDTAAAGTKAEEFLVGSLASWGLAGGASLLAWLLA